MAALDSDVDDMTQGLQTRVGPSSALDAETEQVLWHRLREERAATAAPRTLLVVSHRAAALAQADQVVHLDAGRVVAIGTPDELRNLELAGHAAG